MLPKLSASTTGARKRGGIPYLATQSIPPHHMEGGGGGGGFTPSVYGCKVGDLLLRLADGEPPLPPRLFEIV